jgi:dTDP-3-amino-3,4,6-trideoxy-alpha-D-glucose transaminase
MSTIAVQPRVPLLRITSSDPQDVEELVGAVAALAATGEFTLGSAVAAFEREFADFCGAAHAVGVSSGTDALVLALRALGLRRDDEVIVPANSFIATAEAVSLAGGAPRLVDVDAATGLLTAEIVEQELARHPNVRCIIPVHLYGATVDMDPILEVARDRSIHVVEDAAQAHGAIYKGRRVGTLGDIGCFSFYPTKNLGGWGDGGAVTTDDDDLAYRVRLLRSHGEHPRYHHQIVGATARLDALQAAVLKIKLRRLDAANDRRRQLAEMLRRALQEAYVDLPPVASPGHDHVHHLFVVRTTARDQLRAHLDAAGIDSAVHYPVPIHLSDAYRSLGFLRGDLPVVERHAATSCSLPFWPAMTDDELRRVAAAVRGFDATEEGF